MIISPIKYVNLIVGSIHVYYSNLHWISLIVLQRHFFHFNIYSKIKLSPNDLFSIPMVNHYDIVQIIVIDLQFHTFISSLKSILNTKIFTIEFNSRSSINFKLLFNSLSLMILSILNSDPNNFTYAFLDSYLI